MTNTTPRYRRAIVLLLISTIECASAIFAITSSGEKQKVFFSVAELIHSDTAMRLGIDNTPSRHHIANLNTLIERVLNPARIRLAKPIYVNSGYRCPQLNSAVGGAPRSYHMEGRAADVTTGDLKTNRHLYIILYNLPHTELIWEQGGVWIHVAL